MTNVISAVLNVTIRELKQTLLRGGGAGAKYKKRYSRKGKLNGKKNSCTPINPKKYSFYGLKLKFMKEFDNEKKFPRLQIPHRPLPHNFFSGPSQEPRSP